MATRVATVTHEVTLMTTATDLCCEAGSTLMILNGVVVGVHGETAPAERAAPAAPRRARKMGRHDPEVVKVTKDRILYALDNTHGAAKPPTSMELGDHLGFSRADRTLFHAALQALETAGIIRPTGTARNNRAWELVV